MQGKVYEDNQETIEALNTNLRKEIPRIQREMWAKVIQNFNVQVATPSGMDQTRHQLLSCSAKKNTK